MDAKHLSLKEQHPSVDAHVATSHLLNEMRLEMDLYNKMFVDTISS